MNDDLSALAHPVAPAPSRLRRLELTGLALLSFGIAAYGILSAASGLFLLTVPEKRDIVSAGAILFAAGVGVGTSAFGLIAWRARLGGGRPWKLLTPVGAASLVVGLVAAAVLPVPPAYRASASGLLVDVDGAASIAGPIGWAEKRNDDRLTHSIAFSRDLFTDRSKLENNETLRADLTVTRADGVRLDHQAFFADVLATVAADREGGRLTQTSFTSRPETSLGAECMRYDRVVEDRGVPTFPNAVFILANYNVVCFHPTRPIVVTAGWSHRYPQTITPQVGDSDADVYLNTLRFIGDKETPPAPVTPTLGSTVFSDDFTGSSNWIKYDNEFVLARYRGPGTYEIVVRKENSFAILSTQMPSRRDVDVEAEITFGGSYGVVGPICRWSGGSKSTYYGFIVSTNGYYAIARVKDGSTPTVLADSIGTNRAAIAAGKRRIEAECLGGGSEPTTLVLRVDGTELLQIQDEASADLETVGTAGIFMQGSTGFDVTATRFLVREASAR